MKGGRMGERGQKVQTPTYKRNKFWGCNEQHSDKEQKSHPNISIQRPRVLN